MSTYTATFPAQNTSNAKNLHSEKETVAEMHGVLVHDGEEQISTPVTVRWYMGRSANANVVHCSIWVGDHAEGRYYSGYGKAGGYGYCRKSAAFQAALDSAGIGLSHDVAGVGMDAVKDAILAILQEIKNCKYRTVLS